MLNFLKWLIAILIILWIVGLVIDIVGSLIHILLVVAIIAGIYYFITSRSGAPAP
jgi:uncharacterized membrane protein